MQEYPFLGFVVCGLGPAARPIAFPDGASSRVSHLHHAVVLECIPDSEEHNWLPEAFAECCMVPGVHIDCDIHSEHTSTNVYSTVMTDTNGSNLYASCLTYYEDLPAAVVCSNPAWLGAKASKCLSIVSKYPYFTTMEAILKRLFASMFLSGTRMAVADVLQHIMSVPCPGLGSLHDTSQVWFRVDGRPQCLLPPSLMVHKPAHEIPVKPLADLLSVDNMLLVFLAVLLEQHVMIRSEHGSQLSRVCEAVRQVVYPCEWMMPYCPCIPASLLQVLHSPFAVFLGIEKNLQLEEDVIEGYVVVDIDNDEVHVPRFDPGGRPLPDLKQLLKAAPMQRLSIRLKHLLQPEALTTVTPRVSRPATPVAVQPAPSADDGLPTPVSFQGLRLTYGPAAATPTPTPSATNASNHAGSGHNKSDSWGAFNWDPSALFGSGKTDTSAHTAVPVIDPHDVWCLRADRLFHASWGWDHEQLVRRMFLECMEELLSDHHQYLDIPMIAASGNLQQNAGQPHSHTAGSLTGRSGAKQGMMAADNSPAAAPTAAAAADGGAGAAQVQMVLAAIPDNCSVFDFFRPQEFVAFKDRSCKLAGKLLGHLMETQTFRAGFLDTHIRSALAHGGHSSLTDACYQWLRLGRKVLRPGPIVTSDTLRCSSPHLLLELSSSLGMHDTSDTHTAQNSANSRAARALTISSSPSAAFEERLQEADEDIQAWAVLSVSGKLHNGQHLLGETSSEGSIPSGDNNTYKGLTVINPRDSINSVYSGSDKQGDEPGGQDDVQALPMVWPQPGPGKKVMVPDCKELRLQPAVVGPYRSVPPFWLHEVWRDALAASTGICKLTGTIGANRFAAPGGGAGAPPSDRPTNLAAIRTRRRTKSMDGSPLQAPPSVSGLGRDSLDISNVTGDITASMIMPSPRSPVSPMANALQTAASFQRASPTAATAYDRRISNRDILARVASTNFASMNSLALTNPLDITSLGTTAASSVGGVTAGTQGGSASPTKMRLTATKGAGTTGTGQSHVVKALDLSDGGQQGPPGGSSPRKSRTQVPDTPKAEQQVVASWSDVDLMRQQAKALRLVLRGSQRRRTLQDQSSSSPGCAPSDTASSPLSSLVTPQHTSSSTGGGSNSGLIRTLQISHPQQHIEQSPTRNIDQQALQMQQARVLLRLQHGCSSWKLIACLRQELDALQKSGALTLNSDASARSATCNRQLQTETIPEDGSDTSPNRKGANNVAQQQQQQVCQLSELQCDVISDMISGLIDVAVRHSDWWSMSSLLQTAAMLTSSSTTTSSSNGPSQAQAAQHASASQSVGSTNMDLQASNSRAVSMLEQLAFNQPLLHSSSVWSSFIRHVLSSSTVSVVNTRPSHAGGSSSGGTGGAAASRLKSVRSPTSPGKNHPAAENGASRKSGPGTTVGNMQAANNKAATASTATYTTHYPQQQQQQLSGAGASGTVTSPLQSHTAQDTATNSAGLSSDSVATLSSAMDWMSRLGLSEEACWLLTLDTIAAWYSTGRAGTFAQGQQPSPSSGSVNATAMAAHEPGPSSSSSGINPAVAAIGSQLQGVRKHLKCRVLQDDQPHLRTHVQHITYTSGTAPDPSVSTQPTSPFMHARGAKDCSAPLPQRNDSSSGHTTHVIHAGSDVNARQHSDQLTAQSNMFPVQPPVELSTQALSRSKSVPPVSALVSAAAADQGATQGSEGSHAAAGGARNSAQVVRIVKPTAPGYDVLRKGPASADSQAFDDAAKATASATQQEGITGRNSSRSSSGSKLVTPRALQKASSLHAKPVWSDVRPGDATKNVQRQSSLSGASLTSSASSAVSASIRTSQSTETGAVLSGRKSGAPLAGTTSSGGRSAHLTKSVDSSQARKHLQAPSSYTDRYQHSRTPSPTKSSGGVVANGSVTPRVGGLVVSRNLSVSKQGSAGSRSGPSCAKDEAPSPFSMARDMQSPHTSRVTSTYGKPTSHSTPGFLSARLLGTYSRPKNAPHAAVSQSMDSTAGAAPTDATASGNALKPRSTAGMMSARVAGVYSPHSGSGSGHSHGSHTDSSSMRLRLSGSGSLSSRRSGMYTSNTNNQHTGSPGPEPSVLSPHPSWRKKCHMITEHTAMGVKACISNVVNGPIQCMAAMSGVAAIGSAEGLHVITIRRPSEDAVVATMKLPEVLISGNACMEQVAVVPNTGMVVAASSRDHAVMVFDINTSRHLATMKPAFKAPVSSLCVGDSSSLLLGGGRDGHLHLWDIRRIEGSSMENRSKALVSLSTGGVPVSIVMMSRVTGEILAGCEDGSVFIWNIKSPTRPIMTRLCGHTGPVTHILEVPASPSTTNSLSSPQSRVSSGGGFYNINRSVSVTTKPATSSNSNSKPAPISLASQLVLVTCSQDWTARVWVRQSQHANSPALNAKAKAGLPMGDNYLCCAVLVAHAAPVTGACILPGNAFFPDATPGTAGNTAAGSDGGGASPGVSMVRSPSRSSGSGGGGATVNNSSSSSRRCVATCGEDGCIAVWDLDAASSAPGAGCIWLNKAHPGDSIRAIFVSKYSHGLNRHASGSAGGGGSQQLHRASPAKPEALSKVAAMIKGSTGPECEEGPSMLVTAAAGGSMASALPTALMSLCDQPTNGLHTKDVAMCSKEDKSNESHDVAAGFVGGESGTQSWSVRDRVAVGGSVRTCMRLEGARASTVYSASETGDLHIWWPC